MFGPKKILLFGAFLIYSNVTSAMIHRVGSKDNYEQIVKDRIARGLKGDGLIEPKAWDLNTNLPVRLAREGRLDLLKKLLEHDPSLKNNNTLAETLIKFSGSSFGNGNNKLEFLINLGINPNLCNKYSNFGTALNYACQANNNEKTIQYLLANNANPNIKNASEYSALSYAFTGSVSLRNKIKYIIMLITSGSIDNKAIKQLYGQIHMIKYDFVPNLICRRNRLFEKVKNNENIYFIPENEAERKYWISLRHARDEEGNSLLHHAILNENYIVAQKLITQWPELLSQKNFNMQTLRELQVLTGAIFLKLLPGLMPD